MEIAVRNALYAAQPTVQLIGGNPPTFHANINFGSSTVPPPARHYAHKMAIYYYLL